MHLSFLISPAKQWQTKKMTESFHTVRCSVLFDMGVIMVHLHLQEVAGCFSLIFANIFFMEHQDWAVLINTAKDNHRKSVVMENLCEKLSRFKNSEQNISYWKKIERSDV